MAIILNELSLTGQFSDKQDFYKNLKDFISIVSSFNHFKIPTLKGYDIYSRNISSRVTLFNCVSDKSDREPTIISYRNELTKLISNPYWEDFRKHTCKDKYISVYTKAKCDYGLAEAVENLRVVVSFPNKAFKTSKLGISKNGTNIELKNIYNNDTLKTILIELIDSGEIKDTLTSDDYLPNKSITNKILPKESLRKHTEGMTKGEQVAVYLSYGNCVAVVNFWEFDRVVTGKNQRKIYTRKIYKKKINGKNHYLSIDTENGVYELFNSAGNHLGEFNFKEIPTQHNPKSHKIKIK